MMALQWYDLGIGMLFFYLADAVMLCVSEYCWYMNIMYLLLINVQENLFLTTQLYVITETNILDSIKHKQYVPQLCTTYPAFKWISQSIITLYILAWSESYTCTQKHNFNNM